MMALSSLIVGVLLLLLLLAVAVKGWLALRETPELSGSDESEQENQRGCHENTAN